MWRFDLDQQRAVACCVGLLGLIGEAFVYSVFGVQVSEILTGAFVTLAIGPVITGTIEKIRTQPPPTGGRRETDGKDDEPTDSTLYMRPCTSGT